MISTVWESYYNSIQQIVGFLHCLPVTVRLKVKHFSSSCTHLSASMRPSHVLGFGFEGQVLGLGLVGCGLDFMSVCFICEICSYLYEMIDIGNAAVV